MTLCGVKLLYVTINRRRRGGERRGRRAECPSETTTNYSSINFVCVCHV